MPVNIEMYMYILDRLAKAAEEVLDLASEDESRAAAWKEELDRLEAVITEVEQEWL